jgi:MFS family permease
VIATNATLGVLRHGTFRALWSAALISNLGGLIQAVGAAWLMIGISDSRSMVALVQAATTLPIMLFSLPSGALADSFDRRRIMLLALVLMLVVSLALTVFAYAGLVTPWLLLGLTFLIGCGQALFNPSWQSSMGDIVPKHDLAAAVTLNGMGFNMMRSVGPAVGGLIVTVAGVAMAFAVNTVSYVTLIVALLRWSPPKSDRPLPRETLGAAMSAGLRYTAMSPGLLRVILRGFVFGAGAIVLLALLPIVARNLPGGSALGYGVLLGSFGLGAIGGGLASAALRGRMTNETIVRVAFAVIAVAAVGLGLSRSMVLNCLILMPCGAAWVLALSLFNVTVQLSTPRWVVGRALAIYQTATFGGMAGSAWFWGAVAETYGVSTALILSSLPLLLGGLVGLRLPLENFAIRDLDPLNRFVEPSLRLDLKPRSGPIMVMVDYDIDQKDVPAFLAAMIDRRRIRIRDGARQWVLLRDLENPDVWTESYHVATWVEYVRHHQRRVKSDAEVTERLLSLHKGESPPRVHRMIERQTVPRHDDTPVKAAPASSSFSTGLI